jgi:hypothetical protein
VTSEQIGLPASPDRLPVGVGQAREGFALVSFPSRSPSENTAANFAMQ